MHKSEGYRLFWGIVSLFAAISAGLGALIACWESGDTQSSMIATAIVLVIISLASGMYSSFLGDTRVREPYDTHGF